MKKTKSQNKNVMNKDITIIYGSYVKKQKQKNNNLSHRLNKYYITWAVLQVAENKSN